MLGNHVCRQKMLNRSRFVSRPQRRAFNESATPACNGQLTHIPPWEGPLRLTRTVANGKRYEAGVANASLVYVVQLYGSPFEQVRAPFRRFLHLICFLCFGAVFLCFTSRLPATALAKFRNRCFTCLALDFLSLPLGFSYSDHNSTSR